MTGKPLTGYTGGPIETINDRSNFILINRQDVLGTALEEISSVEDFQLSLEVSFYGGNAQDAGGPRREFFRLCLQKIKQKHFDNGLKEHLSEDYKTVGIILALSVLQNGNIPRFLTEDQLQEISIDDVPKPSAWLLQVKGLTSWVEEIAKRISNFSTSFPTLRSSCHDKKEVDAHTCTQILRRWMQCSSL